MGKTPYQRDKGIIINRKSCFPSFAQSYFHGVPDNHDFFISWDDHDFHRGIGCIDERFLTRGAIEILVPIYPHEFKSLQDSPLMV